MVIAQYRELLSQNPDAQPLWYLMARALRRSDGAGGLPSCRAMSAMTTATRLFASMSSTRGAPSLGGPRVAYAALDHDGAGEHGRGAAWDAVHYLRGSRDMSGRNSEKSAVQPIRIFN